MLSVFVSLFRIVRLSVLALNPGNDFFHVLQHSNRCGGVSFECKLNDAVSISAFYGDIVDRLRFVVLMALKVCYSFT